MFVLEKFTLVTRVALFMAPKIRASRLFGPTLSVMVVVVMAVVLLSLQVAFPIVRPVPVTTLLTVLVERFKFPSPVRVPLTPRVWVKLFPVVSVATLLLTAATVLSLIPLTPLKLAMVSPAMLASTLDSPALLAPVLIARLLLSRDLSSDLVLVVLTFPSLSPKAESRLPKWGMTLIYVAVSDVTGVLSWPRVRCHVRSA